MDHLTTCLFRGSRPRWQLDGAWNSGPQSVFGETQTRRTDAGGRWFMERSIVLSKPNEIRTYEALLLGWNNGNDRMVVHRMAGHLLAGGTGGLVPFSDGSTFSDGSQFVSGQANAELVEDAIRRATELTVRVAGARAFLGGEPFTIVGPVYLDRLYGAARVLSSTADGEATVYRLETSPPLREPAAAGTRLDFNDPRVVMKVNMTAEGLHPDYESGVGTARLSFEETQVVS